MDMTTTESPVAYGELTNTCTCSVYDETNDTFIPTSECFGDCWDTELEFFGEAVKDILAQSEWFRVEAIRLWSGDFDAIFRADNVADFVRGITVNSEWILRYQVFADRVEFSLSHHDAPTGSASVVRPLVAKESD
jgi:hypothetical protein